MVAAEAPRALLAVTAARAINARRFGSHAFGRWRASRRVGHRILGLLLLALGLVTIAAQTAWAQGTAIHPTAGPWPHVAEIIVNPWATVALLAAGCLLLYHDLLTPLTWGATGTLGVIAGGLVFAAHITVGGFGWVGVVLMLFGLAAILLEIHVFPGRGSAFAGFLLMFVGMFLSLGGPRHVLFALTLSSILIVVSGVAFLAYLPKSPAWQKLADTMQHDQTSVFAPLYDDANYEPLPVPSVGAEGRATTTLRPTGQADFGNGDQTVVTEGDFLEARTPLVISHINGYRVVVEPLADAALMNDAGNMATA